MLMLLLWSLPTLVHLTRQSRDQSLVIARRVDGLVPVGWWWIGWGVVVGLVSLMLGMVTSVGLPAGLTTFAGATGAIMGFAGMLGVAAAATGEETFFRGFLQGHLTRRFGERVALWGQAALFLLPHLPSLLVDARLWVLLPVQFLTGLMLGLLRRGSGSILPPVTAHVLTNVAAGVLLA